MTTQFQTVFAGQSESPIKLIYMVTDQPYNTITTAGFLNNFLNSGYNFAVNDVVVAFYGTNSATLGIFYVTESNGIFTLNLNSDIPPASITNADIAANAAIAFSKFAALSNTSILVGNASNVATAVAVSGDATLSNAGALTIANNAITTAKINTAAVTLAKLAAGITPSHITVFSGRITWSGSGASLTTTVTGVLATDQIVATIRSAPTEAAYIAGASTNTNQVILTLSAANTSNDAIITYNVLRAAS